MKYRHSYHAGNFADVHKHVTLLALLASLGRKDKGFFYLETHAGSGEYAASEEAEAGIARIATATFQSEELRQYVAAVTSFRKSKGNPRAYPGSPLLAARMLRAQDRGIAVEIQPPEARALERALGHDTHMRVETGDGFQRLRAHMPPAERRGLVLIDPPYEETRQDFERVTAAMTDSLRRFATGVFCAWYPIKEERDIASWKTAFSRALGTEVLFSELWLYPRDSRVGLNGSGLAIVNPPYQIEERMKVWLPELHAALDSARAGGSSVEVSPR
jgi:23S rRNA (adenine2030-N6)-methyltransferase